ncbi:uncharacterized protein BX664DRAFT_324494, partial [Halteromyces radiatus]|uniref:uncharacterized protein n=1 Tax=Halteromyces radiatus TaxID=101107 RepID=UPI00221FAB5C
MNIGSLGNQTSSKDLCHIDLYYKTKQKKKKNRILPFFLFLFFIFFFMDIATRKKQGVERQTTFGPSAPIDEWELEKATILREAKENKERAERLQQKLEQDQLTYEKNTSSLLKEVKLKELTWEKRRQEMDENWMNQVLELQRQLEKENDEHQENLRSIKAQMEATLQAEQKKNDRRVANLHSRLEAKEKILQQYLEQQSTSPITPSASTLDNPSISSPVTPSNDTQHIRKLERQLVQQKQQYEQLQQRYDMILSSIESPSSTSYTTMIADHNKKIQALTDAHVQEQQRLRDNFMNENSALTMHMEARLQNLQNEYEDTLRETREQFATEKEVWRIEQQAKMDHALREMEEKHMDQKNELDRQWRNKLRDMEASLSKDGTAIQAHWQSKLQSLEEQHQKDMTRLRGELDVVKERLGNDIERRHQVQARLAALESKYHQDHLIWTRHKAQLDHLLQQQQKTTKVNKIK